MKSDLPKVLHEICGRPMLSYVLSACRLAGTDRLVVVVGHGKAQVMERYHRDHDITWVEQREQRGTGHAVLCCREALRDFRGSVLVIAGDMPLVRRETLVDLLETREQTHDALTMATTVLEAPKGYGRIVRDAQGALEAIVEDRDCTEAQKALTEVNPSYYCFDSAELFEALEAVQHNPATGECFLTDTVAILRRRGRGVSAHVTAPAEDAMGINSRLDIARVSRAMQDRLQLALINEGVTIVDPDNTWIEAEATVGKDTVIQPFSFIGAGATIGEGCTVGPFAYVANGETISGGTPVGASRLFGAASS